MAQFRATIQGQRGQASRLGHKRSGITAVISGWSGGVRVEAHFDEATQRDMFHVYATGGSNALINSRYIGTVSAEGVWLPNLPKVSA